MALMTGTIHSSIYKDAKPTDILKQKSKDWRIASSDLEQNSKPKIKKQPVAKEVPVLPAPAPTPVRSPIAERLQGTVKTRLASKAPVPEPQAESTSILNMISESYQERNQRVLHNSATPPKQADTDEGKLAREGGVNHVHMLFKASVSNSKPISDYAYRDVAVLPPQECSKWLGPDGAYAQELEALRAQGVFGDLQELPKGRRAIGNRWVHAEKSDGRLKARLVA
jgi:hypothetical protein